MPNKFDWIPFYEALADRLLEYKDRRSELFEIMKRLSAEQPLMKYLNFDRDDWWSGLNYVIDPFSVMGVLNRKVRDEKRIELASVYADEFSIKVPLPTGFDGIPILNNVHSFFNGTEDVWALFVSALECAKSGSLTDEFKFAFERAVMAKGNAAPYISMGLFWIRPNFFMPMDGNSRAYITKRFEIKVPEKKCKGEEYVQFLKELREKIDISDPGRTLYEISHESWLSGRIQPTPPIKPPRPVGTHDLFDKNLILYGPPGTGKTYSAIQYAVAIIEEKSIEDIIGEEYSDVFARYLKYREDKLVEFTTFHQSYGYEEFIEGIRPVVTSEEEGGLKGEIRYEIRDGVFKDFCDKAGNPVGGSKKEDLGIGKNPNVWKVSLGGTGENPDRKECLNNGHIRIGWDQYGEVLTEETDYVKDGGRVVLNAFYNNMQIGDLVLSCFSSRTIDAIGVVTGEPEWHNEYPIYKRLRKVKWLARDIREDIVDMNADRIMTLSTVYKLSITVSDTLGILHRVNPSLFSAEMKVPNRVFIIDEINRGNISKIFGELITLIEPTKRLGEEEAQRSVLPYSGQKFGVPRNVYIIGTMNTADRSIAMIDTALRRRFGFIEMQPDPGTLEGTVVEDIDIADLLETMNKRITVLHDREHTIGHSYFMPLSADPSIENLASIFKHKIIPLLQEYFFDDYEKIRMILGDNRKTQELQFIIKKVDTQELFGNSEMNLDGYFEINDDAFMKVGAYALLQ